MRIVVDTNILFTFFWKKSVFHKISIKQDFDLIAPEFALEEINKHKIEIMKKTEITEQEFRDLRKELAIRVEFIPLEEYASYFKQAISLAKEIPEELRDGFLDDIDFIALALKEKCPLWTHDTLLKKQSSIKIFETKEVIKLLNNGS